MAWVWWLLAPIVSTVAGATVLWWRTRTEGGYRRHGSDAISEHQALLRALAAKSATEPLPVTMRVLADQPSTD